MGTVACGQIFKGASRSFTYRHERLWYRDEFPYHQHPEYEITVVFSGNGQRVTNDFTEPFREGEVVVLPPYFPHGWVYDKALCAPDGMIENGSLQFGEEFLVQLSQLSPEFQPVVRFYKELRQAVGHAALPWDAKFLRKGRFNAGDGCDVRHGQRSRRPVSVRWALISLGRRSRRTISPATMTAMPATMI